MELSYGLNEPPTALQTASLLLSDPQPHTRQLALQVLTALSQPDAAAAPARTVDAIFQQLCVVAATDSISRLRLQALEALADMHHASTAIKLQALSKKATLRVMLPSAAAQTTAQTAAAGSRGSQQPPAKKQKQWQQQQKQQQGQDLLPGDAALLDAATGALLHGTEDDLPRVRLAAVAAVASLSSRDLLFANAAGFLLADLVGDQLLEVRVAALRALLAHATAFQQRKQQQQQQKQQDCQKEAADAAGAAAAAAHATDWTDTDMEEAAAPDALDEGPPEAAMHGEAGAGTQQHHQQQQQQQARRANKVRKSDLPSWGKDALLAAATVLTDREPAVRQLALQLLLLLPPANVPDLVMLVQGLACCCELWPGQHAAEVSAVVEQLTRRRAEVVTLAAAKLVPLLARVLEPGRTTTAAGSAGASSAVSSGNDSTSAQLPAGAQLMASLLFAAVQQRKQGLQALLKELGKAGLLQLPVLQPWVAKVQALQQQYQQQQGPTEVPPAAGA